MFWSWAYAEAVKAKAAAAATTTPTRRATLPMDIHVLPVEPLVVRTLLTCAHHTRRAGRCQAPAGVMTLNMRVVGGSSMANSAASREGSPSILSAPDTT